MRKLLNSTLVGLVGLVMGGCFSVSNSLDSQLAQIRQDTTTISSYIAANSIPATKMEPGIWFTIDSLTQGLRPTYNDSVYLTYTLKSLATGGVLDQKNTPTLFQVSEMIYGMEMALPQFAKGSKGHVYIPSSYGYGSIANAAVPANTNLIMSFTVNDVKDFQLRQDTVAIDTFLTHHSVKALVDPSGVRYTMTNGTGATPVLRDEVTVNYTLNTMSTNSTVVQEANGATFQLASLLPCWQVVLLKASEGASITIYSPSSLAFGPVGLQGTTITANQNVIFTIQLLKVTHR